MNIQIHILIFKNSKFKIDPKVTLIKENSGNTKLTTKERTNGSMTRSIYESGKDVFRSQHS